MNKKQGKKIEIKILPIEVLRILSQGSSGTSLGLLPKHRVHASDIEANLIFVVTNKSKKSKTLSLGMDESGLFLEIL